MDSYLFLKRRMDTCMLFVYFLLLKLVDMAVLMRNDNVFPYVFVCFCIVVFMQSIRTFQKKIKKIDDFSRKHSLEFWLLLLMKFSKNRRHKDIGEIFSWVIYIMLVRDFLAIFGVLIFRDMTQWSSMVSHWGFYVVFILTQYVCFYLSQRP